MTYSVDFRKKVLTIYHNESLTLANTAKRFQVGEASIVRWMKQLEPKATRDRRRPRIPDDVLLKEVEQYPDAYQYERNERLGVSTSGIGQAGPEAMWH